jgi:hypothetical protein
MNDDKKEIIFSTDERAAKYVTNIEGWVDRHGHFWGKGDGAERMARNQSATHIKCDVCGEVREINRRWCEKCRQKQIDEHYDTLEFKEWDETTPVCIYDSDTYFWDIDDIDYYCDEHNISDASTIQLVWCEPVMAHEIDLEDWVDDLPDNDCEPDELCELIDNFNKDLKELKPLSYVASNIRTTYNHKYEEHHNE